MADTRIKSIFNEYAEQLQAMIDAKADAFAPLWFPNYFGWDTPSMSLNFTTVIGRTRIEAAAAIVDRNSPAPVGSRNNLEKYSGEVPAIKKKFRLGEEDYRNFIVIQNMNLPDATKKTQLLNLMWDDLKKAGDAPLKTLDRMVLEGISTGSITITTTNNPEGIITDTIDLFMPKGNKVFCSVVWATSASAKPLVDILTTVKAAAARGITFGKILMDLTTFWNLSAATDTINQLGGFYHMGSGQKSLGTLDEINALLAAKKMPVIEIVNESIGIEKDGAITSSNPFATNTAVFVPSGNLGSIKNALAMEEMKPVEGVRYAKKEAVLVSKWSDNDPFAEWTCGELNAFPAIESIDSIYIMNTGATS